jgi:thiamine-phosphate pyrophosphorylase
VSDSSLLLPRLYAILDLELAARCQRDPEAVCAAWLEAGVRLIQLRAKHLAAGPLVAVADRLATEIQAAGGRFIVNDRVDVAILARADGVHVGQDDLTPAAVRRAYGTRPGDAIVGLSTHTDAQVAAGVLESVSYLAIGPVFETSTKERPDPVVGLEGVTRARIKTSAAGMPLVAIGGIDERTARAVIDAGADSVAIAGALIGEDPGASARALLEVLSR